jgi:asparagine synthase (glutamine-hydrolysing)
MARSTTFHEVRSKLQNEGLSFTSESDTEVVLKAYGRWGEQCLTLFRGMFAFAIWDASRNRFFVARDAMGVKPLYCFQSEKHFLFASEIRTLLGTGRIPRHLDGAGVLSYLAFGSVYEPNTLIEGVSVLPPRRAISRGKTARLSSTSTGTSHRARNLNNRSSRQGDRPTHKLPRQ